MIPDDVLVETDCDGGVLGTCLPSELKRAVRVTICDTSTPPVPVDVTVVRCGNTTEDILSEDSPAQQVVISGSTKPIPVCIEGEKDFDQVYKCDVNTGNTILIRTTLDHDTGIYVTTYYDLVIGAGWTGDPSTDLTECQTGSASSDQIVSDVFAPLDTAGSYTGQVIRVDRQYSGGVLVSETYYDTVTGASISLPAGTTQLAPVSNLDSEMIELCDDNGSFLRHIAHFPGGQPIVVRDTNIDGTTPYTPVGTIGICSGSPNLLVKGCDKINGQATTATTATPTGNSITITPDISYVNDSILQTTIFIDFGQGVMIPGAISTPATQSFANIPAGTYIGKVYYRSATSQHTVVDTIIMEWDGYNFTSVNIIPADPTLSYDYSIETVNVITDGNGNQLFVFDQAMNPYTIQGAFTTDCDRCCEQPIVPSNVPAQKGGNIVECATPIGGTVSEALDNNLEAICTVLGSPGAQKVHTLLGNVLTMNGDGTSPIMAAGLNISLTATTSANFIFNIDSVSDSDPGDPADLGVVVWDNLTGTSVTASNIAAPTAPAFDLQGIGLNMPIYGVTAPQSFQIIWDGILPAGDYTVAFLNQNQIGDQTNISIVDNIPPVGSTVSNAQLVALDQCTIEALNPPVIPVVEKPNGLVITNAADMTVITNGTTVRSFSVKDLDGTGYDITFDSGGSWSMNITGGDSWGEGNDTDIDISQVTVRPSVSGNRVFIHWETV